MNEYLGKESDVAGVRLRTVAGVSLLIHLMAFYSATGIIGIIENSKKKNYISVELIQNARGFNQANARSVRQPEVISQPVERTERAAEDTMSLTPQIDPLAASVHSEASNHETGPVSNAKSGYLAVHRVGKQPYFKIQVKPVYPAQERSAGIEAKVIAEVYINEYGGVDDVKIIKSAGRIFDEAVLKAVKDSSFSPGYLEGSPVAVKVQIPYVFRLR